MAALVAAEISTAAMIGIQFRVPKNCSVQSVDHKSLYTKKFELKNMSHGIKSEKNNCRMKS